MAGNSSLALSVEPDEIGVNRSDSGSLVFTGNVTISRLVTGFNESLMFTGRPWNPWPGVDLITYAVKNIAGRYWNPSTASFGLFPVTLGFVEFNSLLIPGNANLRPSGRDPGWRTYTGTSATSEEIARTIPQQFLMGGPLGYRVQVRPEVLPADSQPLILELRFLFIEQEHAAIIDFRLPTIDIRRGVMLHQVPFIHEEGRPIATIWFPAPGAVTTSPVTISGSVSEPAEGFVSGLRSASLQIRDLETNLYFNPRFDSWSEYSRATALDLQSINGASAAATFSHVWDEPATGSQRYRAELEAQDEAGNWSVRSTRDFFVDRERPVISIEWPEPINDLEQGVPIAGTVTDDREVAELKLQIYDTITGYAWDPATEEFVDRMVYIELPVGRPREDYVDFSYTWQPNRAGNFATLIRVRDTAGRTAASQQTFEVIAPEVVQPFVLSITTPATEGEVLPLGIVSLAGLASSDKGISEVHVKLYDLNGALGIHTWNGSLWEDPGFEYRLRATLTPAGPNGTAVWSYDFDAAAAAALGGSGIYLVRVDAIELQTWAYTEVQRSFLVV